MSSNGKKRRPEHYSASKLVTGRPAANDGDAPYSQEQLIRMNERFVERMQRAIERGLERRPDGERPERAA
jgi:hypothetical protein